MKSNGAGTKMPEKRCKMIDIYKNIAYNNIAGSDTLYNRVTEFTFKCHGYGTGHDAAVRRFFFTIRRI